MAGLFCFWLLFLARPSLKIYSLKIFQNAEQRGDACNAQHQAVGQQQRIEQPIREHGRCENAQREDAHAIENIRGCRLAEKVRGHRRT
ncbi:hypothetical protein [Paraburkholderia solisilvae]|uniref:hypothetical protein n=1 Tax=Paraburkholderia solisilvae TaxID=624376 RepID=UPI001582AB29|nr:hypothetical protein [Paraburkholderia solisilvae]